MTEQEQGQPTPEQQTDDATGTKGGEGEGLTEAQLHERIASGDFDVAALAKETVPKGQVNAIVEERLQRQRQTLQDNFLKGLGVANEEEAKSIIESYRQAEAEERTELENANQTIQSLTAERDSLTEAKQKADRYEAALKSQVEAQLETVPEYVRELLSERDPVAQMDYLTKHRESFAPASAKGPGSQPERDDTPESVWDMPKERFEELQRRASAGERVALPSQR